MAHMTNILLISMLSGTFILATLSHIPAVRGRLHTGWLDSIVNAALFASLSVPFLWAWLTVAQRIGFVMETCYAAVLIAIVFFMALRTERMKCMARRAIRANRKQKPSYGNVYADLPYDELEEIVRKEAGIPKCSPLSMKSPETPVSLVMEVNGKAIEKPEILQYVNECYGQSFTGLVNDSKGRRVIFIAG